MTLEINRSIKLFQDAQELLPGGVDSPVRAFRAVGGQPLFIEKDCRTAQKNLERMCLSA